MSFAYGSWTFILVFVAISICWFFWKQEKKMNQWVQDHWFFKQSLYSKWAMRLFLSSIFLFIISLADLRGKAESVITKIPLQRTVLLIDVSLSMFAEDIRPNRLEKATQIAKHIVRKAMGHNISLAIFSDIQKQLVPFTDDIDLLDARLAALRKLDLNRGGSSIKKSVQEALAYLVQDSGKKDRPSGNIIIISDSDETFSEFNLKIPDSVTVAYIAVGTGRGGEIPLRDKRGNLIGYKKYEGQKVVSKINESELRKWKSSIKNFYYWIVSSYSIPTEEILLFLKEAHHSKFIEKESLARPVLMEYVVVPALVLFILSLIFRQAPRYKLGAFFWVLLTSTSLLYANQNIDKKKEDELEKFMESSLYLNFKKGEVTKKERLKIAEKYLRLGKYEQALDVYRENLSVEDIEKGRHSESIINYGTALLKNGHIQEGVDLLSGYKNSLSEERVKKLINENILSVLKREQQKKKQEEQKKKGQSGEKKDENQKSKSDSSDKEGEKQKDPSDPSQNEKSRKKKRPEDNKMRKKVKLPAMLKQLVDKDKKLQEKLLDTKTKSRKSSKQKDW